MYIYVYIYIHSSLYIESVRDTERKIEREGKFQHHIGWLFDARLLGCLGTEQIHGRSVNTHTTNY